MKKLFKKIFAFLNKPLVEGDPNSGEIKVHRCTGTGSMWPTLKPGDRLIVKREWDKVCVGSIVVFYVHTGKGMKRWVHRVVAEGKRDKETEEILSWVTRGDANHNIDHVLCWKSNYVGTVINKD